MRAPKNAWYNKCLPYLGMYTTVTLFTIGVVVWLFCCLVVLLFGSFVVWLFCCLVVLLFGCFVVLIKNG